MDRHSISSTSSNRRAFAVVGRGRAVHALPSPLDFASNVRWIALGIWGVCGVQLEAASPARAQEPDTRVKPAALAVDSAVGQPFGGNALRQDEDSWYAELIGPIDPPRGVLTEGLEWRGNVAVLEITPESVETAGVDDLGPYRVIEYESDFAGIVYVSASTLAVGGTADPWIRLVDLDGRALAEDDDSGGGNAALVEYEIKEGEYLEIHVGVREGEEPAFVGFKVFEGIETEETEALARALHRARENARAALDAGDYEGARASVRAALDGWSADAVRNAAAEVARATRSLGGAAYDAQDSENARRLWEVWLRFEERAHPADYPDLQTARMNLALTIKLRGDLPGARALFELVLAVRERTLPADHPDLQSARQNLAVTMKDQGDLPGARALEEQVLAVREGTLPADHRDLQAARLNLALTMRVQGDLPAARALEEQVLAVFERTLPADHPDLQSARQNLAVTMKDQGDLPGARALEEQVLAVRERMLPADHPHLQTARNNLALTTKAQGDLPGARALQEQVLAVREGTLPADHPDLQTARLNLAGTMFSQGDLRGARALQEQVLAVSERTLPADHPHLQRARGNLALTRKAQGGLTGARALEEQVLAVCERTLPADHPDLQRARLNLASTMGAQGDRPGARALQEQVLAVREGTLPADHPDLLGARQNLAGTMFSQGDLSGARALFEQVLAVRERTLPADHPDLQWARGNLAVTIEAQGDLAGARALEEQVLAVRERTLPADHPDLQTARGNLAGTRTRDRDRGGASELTRTLVRGTVLRLRTDQVLSSRQWEAFSLGQEREVSWSLSFGAADVEALPIGEQFELVESMRSAGASRQRLERQLVVPAELQAELEGLDRAILDRSSDLRTAALRTTPIGDSESAERADASQTFASLQRELDRLQTERSARLQELAHTQGVAMEPTVAPIAAALSEGAAAVGFWRYRRQSIDFEKGEIGPSRPSFLAFVVRKDAPAVRVELGEAAVIERALNAWHAAIGAPVLRGIEVEGAKVDHEAVAGAKLRQLVFDPLRDALGDCRHVILALDSTLHLVPFGALPGSSDHGEEGFLAESWKLEISTTLKELTSHSPKPLHPPRLVAFGGIDYYAEAEPDGEAVIAASSDSSNGAAVGSTAATEPGAAAGQALASTDSSDDADSAVDPTSDSADSEIVTHESTQARGDRDGFSERRRGSRSWSEITDFPHLFATKREADDVVAYFQGAFAESGGEAHVRLESQATRRALRELAPQARFLHLATHAYVEDESIPCITDRRYEEEESFSFLLDRREQVRGLSPMSICGIALAGSNQNDPETGAPLGWFTAAELAELDLSGCELVVLSACNSHVGIERAGQGLASLQQATFVAGARASLTSLWKVDDYATHAFMKRFYELLWFRSLTKRQALVETQKWMRDQRRANSDEPVYKTRDWAAWVLVGREE